MNQYENKFFTLADLAKVNGTTQILEQWQSICDFDLIHRNEIVSSGRHNHITIGRLIPELTNGFFKTGGQGNSDPDLFHLDHSLEEELSEIETFLHENKQDSRNKNYREKKKRFKEILDTRIRIEDKAFSKGERFAWVAKSTFFGNNSGAQKLKEFISGKSLLFPISEEDTRSWILDRNYNNDDYYCLTSTSYWDGNISETEIIFVKTSTLIQCVSGSFSPSKPFCYVDIDLLKTKCTPLILKEEAA